MARKPWYSGPWRRVRNQILERDGHRCQIRGAGCLGHATEVDHILPVSLGGPWYEPSNLRASCRPCNLDRNAPRKTTQSRQW